jgi:hypothetical protein
MIKVNKEQIEEIGKIPGIVTIEENCGGYLCGKEN